MQHADRSLRRRLSPVAAVALATLALVPACKPTEGGGYQLSEPVVELLEGAPNPWPQAAGSVTDADLAEISVDLWEWLLASDPVFATRQGDDRYDGLLDDNHPAARRARIDALNDFLARLGDVRSSLLSDADRVTLEVLRTDVRGRLVEARQDLGAWSLSAMSGPQVDFPSLAVDQPVGTPRQRAAYLKRWRAMGPYLRQSARNLEAALAESRVASRTQLQRVVEQLDLLLATPAHLSPLVEPATGGGTWANLPPGGNLAVFAQGRLGDGLRAEELRLINLHLQDGLNLAQGAPVLVPAADDVLPPHIRGRFLADVWHVVEDEVYPSLRELRRVIRTKVMPYARPDERPGLLYTPGGPAAYRERVELFTTLPLDPEEVHELGLAEVERVRGELVALGRELYGTRNLEDLRAHLDGLGAAHYKDAADILRTARGAVARAEAAVPDAFVRAPSARVQVLPVPAHEEAFTSMAYYRRPSMDGRTPGRYYVNTYDPTSKPRWEAEALAFHEAVPGHHLQRALANERAAAPLAQRLAGVGAFVEGWGLYAEGLADELDLYSGDFMRLGLLSFDAWRSARLVVDTGLHARGWSRAQAIRFLEENTLADRRNIENEVDRYIAWPGQALGYKIGQLELLALRDEARLALGGDFTLAGFHDAVLGAGAVSLPLLRERVRAWIEAVAGR